jgi:hypothetical protein
MTTTTTRSTKSQLSKTQELHPMDAAMLAAESTWAPEYEPPRVHCWSARTERQTVEMPVYEEE